MATWEERMAARAAERSVVREAEDIAYRDANDPHRTHHSHLNGTMVECSCGTQFGLTCVAFPPEAEDEDGWETLACSDCGKRGVTKLPFAADH